MQSLIFTLFLAFVGIASVAGQPACERSDSAKRGDYYIFMPFHGNSIACELSRNSQGDGVKALQKQINMCYWKKKNYIGDKLAEDGDYGANTEKAVRVVQGKVGASADGAYGPDTRGKMGWGLYFNGNPDDIVCHKLTEWDSL